ncbi:DNA mismatch repair endonuclease MutL [Amylibacter sp. SFDW26]|uniref:DNA mismatch repair endonuclease MutL n=1 Tax=Amylibacter sp. SFDW26 TaxID=2652722 RepID=UPI0012618214|nr:DNA mismatch repair endonuclease MutL [Amylibacter sp. SFDW26]KAB7614305.1 DNA mismatch repair endonuclease MutL [Amylibacter sp. SFDW26]
MNTHTPNIKGDRPEIRQLDDAAANRIAAGEVVERPSSAVKELVENSLDAGATRIDIAYADGGKTLIRVSDDGIGIPEDQLHLALSRHATSKIDGTDLLNISSFGFRGEALPSLGAVGRLTISSRGFETDHASEITVNGGDIRPIKPVARSKGTTVELNDLFHATPARLKFLRTDRAEAQAITDVIKRLAMSEPYVGFTLRDVSGGGQGRVTFRSDAQSGDLFDAVLGRLRSILGTEFAENSVALDFEREGLSLHGYASLPTYSRGAAIGQYLFVNGRPVKDRLLLGAVRGAYSDYLSRDRHPVVALFIECDPTLVDVNVHPAKAEVRFRDPAGARSLIVSGLRHALSSAGHRASSTVADATLGAFQAEARPVAPVYQMDQRSRSTMVPPVQSGFADVQTEYSGRVEPVIETVEVEDAAEKPLGAARAQLHENYIIAQTPDGLVIVDQHAAHERLVYEKLKNQMAENGVASQALLLPEVVDLSENERLVLIDVLDELAKFGLVIEEFGGNAVCVRETPAILGEVNAQALVRDICDELTDQTTTKVVADKIEAILSRVACHGSIRSGRQMRAEEMNALLREMEATPHSGQCNHGRPTYVELKLADIERLFGRT